MDYLLDFQGQIFVGFSTAAEDALVDDLEVQAEQENDTASESESEVEKLRTRRKIWPIYPARKMLKSPKLAKRPLPRPNYNFWAVKISFTSF